LLIFAPIWIYDVNVRFEFFTQGIFQHVSRPSGPPIIKEHQLCRHITHLVISDHPGGPTVPVPVCGHAVKRQFVNTTVGDDHRVCSVSGVTRDKAEIVTQTVSVLRQPLVHVDTEIAVIVPTATTGYNDPMCAVQHVCIYNFAF
jgi:hypothetical protein